MTTLDFGLTAAFVLIMILVAGAGVVQALVATILVAYFVYPRILFGEVPIGEPFNGISLSTPLVLTWHVAIVFAVVYGALCTKGLAFRNLWPVVPLITFAGLFFFFVWTPSAPLTAGFLHLLTVSASWAVGAILFSAIHSARGGEQILSKWIAGVAMFIALICVLQISGLDINENSTKLLRSSAGARDSFAGVRVVGTFNEPTAAGKFLFLLAIIAAVWLLGRNTLKKRDSVLFFAAVLVVALLTQTRTNAAATVLLLVLYSLVSGRGKSTRLFLAGGSAALIFFVSRPLWEARSTEDQSLRVHTLKVAWDYIASYPDTWWFGIGPNRYFEVLAPMDSWVASNYPVHNFFVYLLVEMGLAGSLVYLLPFAVLTFGAVKAVRHGADNSSLARAWLCALPGLLLMAMFGWGLLSVVAPALFLIMGYVYASIRGDGREAWPLGSKHLGAQVEKETGSIGEHYPGRRIRL